MLEPVYVDVVVARALDYWSATATTEFGTHVVRLFRLRGSTFMLEVSTLSGAYARHFVEHTCLPPNGMRITFTAGDGQVVLAVYYKPAELPNTGVIEAAKDALTLFRRTR